MAISRRAAAKALGLVGAGALVGAVAEARQDVAGRGDDLRVGGRAVELAVTPIGPDIVRVSVVPLDGGRPIPIPADGSLVPLGDGPPALRVSTLAGGARSFACGDARVTVAGDPLAIRIEAADGRLVQRLRVDAASGALTFDLGAGPVLGFGEGGPQFDRRGAVDRMRSGQGGYRLKTHGGRVPIPWLIGTSGWALFVHHPHGSFDLSGPEGKFVPPGPAGSAPLDAFVVTSRDPARVMAAYARLTGLPPLPPRWALGYMQSHRTLSGPAAILAEAQTFRAKKLPCDALIYLGTGFCPSGWNTGHGSWDFNPANFSDPKGQVEALRALGFRVIPHVVIRAREVNGSVTDPSDPQVVDESRAGSYWAAHRRVLPLADGWWPDEGDPLDIPSRLNRIRMYAEGEQLDRPDARPFALHRNGYAGMQRYGAFLWSGDVYSTWETLKTHIPIALNTGLTGIPYWGTDIGGFVPTKEFTGELYVRWFQFGAFCPSFRAHGRTWQLRLPWGWDTGTIGPDEIRNYGEAANPPASELHNAAVEPICRRYLELRYRLLPYLYAAAWEAHRAGLPLMRALWLHHPDDPAAVARGDEFLWGRDLLVAPVVERGATARSLYLPRGDWYDFWTEEKVAGGREVSRPVDLATTPLYARAGAIIPLGPVKQYVDEPVAGPIELAIYPGAPGAATFYDDDGTNRRDGAGARVEVALTWDDAGRRLTLALAPGAPPWAGPPRDFAAGLVPEPRDRARAVRFDGRPVTVAF